MTSTVKKGDRILLSGTVVEPPDGSGFTTIRLAGEIDQEKHYVRTEILAHAIIEPRPLAVGDRVLAGNNPMPGVVLCIDDGQAWVKWTAERYGRFNDVEDVGDLRRIDGDPK